MKKTASTPFGRLFGFGLSRHPQEALVQTAALLRRLGKNTREVGRLSARQENEEVPSTLERTASKNEIYKAQLKTTPSYWPVPSALNAACRLVPANIHVQKVRGGRNGTLMDRLTPSKVFFCPARRHKDNRAGGTQVCVSNSTPAR